MEHSKYRVTTQAKPTKELRYEHKRDRLKKPVLLPTYDDRDLELGLDDKHPNITKAVDYAKSRYSK